MGPPAEGTSGTDRRGVIGPALSRPGAGSPPEAGGLAARVVGKVLAEAYGLELFGGGTPGCPAAPADPGAAPHGACKDPPPRALGGCKDCRLPVRWGEGDAAERPLGSRPACGAAPRAESGGPCA